MKKELNRIMNHKINCLGCGIVKQSIDNSQPGYVLDKHHDYCQSCFKLMNYGIDTNFILPTKLPEIKENSVIFIVCSILYLDLLFKHTINNEKNKVVFIINKIDLLPRDTNLDYLLDSITHFAKASKVNYYDIILMSANNSYDISNLSSYINHFSEENIYFIGLQNSGKSTLIKALTLDDEILNISKAGLTVETIEKKYNNKKLYDTPGLMQKGYITQFYSYNIYKKILPDREIKPKVYNLKSMETIIIDGLAAVSVIEKDSPVVFYGNNFIKINKGSYPRSVNNMIDKKTYTYTFDKYETKEFNLEKDIKYRITLADFGFVVIEGVNKILVTTHPDLHISLIKEYLK